MNLFEIISENKKHGLPKYVQLQEAILNAIAKGYYKQGDQLPPDLDIVRDTRFSLGTVQAAMRCLLKEGVIVRDQGRGTFVAKIAKLEKPWYCRFSKEENEEDFLPVFPKLVFCKRVTRQERLVRLLNSKTEEFIQIDRVINIGNEFSLYTKFFLNAAQFGGFLSKSKEELERINFKIILRQEYSVEIRRLARFFRFTQFPEMVCRKIHVPLETVGLIQQSTAYSQKDDPIFLQESYLPPNDLLWHMPHSPNIPEDWI